MTTREQTKTEEREAPRSSENGGQRGKISRAPGGASGLLRYLGMPVFLALVCLALYFYIGAKDLDSIEQRALNAGSLTTAVVEHVELVAVSTVIVLVLAVSTGILLTRSFARRVTTPVVAVASVGQAVPSIGLLVLLAFIWDFGFWPAIVALVAYSFLPVLRNTMVGLEQVDRPTIEAGRGMGMTKSAVLSRIELPLAVPIILAGVRTALIINVGTATLAAFVDAGGLGNVINTGIVLARYDTVLVTGAVLTAVLALFIDWLAGIVEDVLRPKGL